MNCPVCSISLMMTDRQGVEINYCPTCRGVWIDRGGLDRIIDRSGNYASDTRLSDNEREHHHQDSYRDLEKRRRRSLLDLFD